MSYQYEMKVGGKWNTNQVRFVTEQEANSAARDLFQSWLAVEDHRTSKSDDEPNYQYNFSQNKAERLHQYI